MQWGTAAKQQQKMPAEECVLLNSIHNRKCIECIENTI